MRYFLRIILLFLLFYGLPLMAPAQNSLINNAEQFYRESQYEKALPLYENLVKTYRTNGVYHHRLGVCILETKGNMQDAEKHLKYAKSKGIRYANLFLGQVYKMQYKFDDAISAYTTYLRGIRSDNENYDFVKKEIEHCQELNKYLLRTEEIEILDAKTVPLKDFQKHYQLSNESGKILTTAEVEENADTTFVMYMNELGDRICYPRIISDTLDTDLFQKNRLLDKWGPEERLSSVINSEGNELYPYILDDGLTLYFSSNGHGGLGGYDIFVTRYNPETNKYLAPVNLGMPYNSVGDDFLFAKDEFSNVAWFASNRNNKKGEITIYSFVPNAMKKTSSLQGNDLIMAARLMFNKDSIQGSDSQNISRENLTKKAFQEENRPIYFVVNDTLIYKSTLQFVSAEALFLFKKGEKNMESLSKYKQEIEDKRAQFAQLKTQEEKQDASTRILDLENKIYALEGTLEEPFQKARNKEMDILAQSGNTIFNLEDYLLEMESVTEIDAPTFILPTIQGNYDVIFSKEENRQFLILDREIAKEMKAIETLQDAPEVLKDVKNSTTSFWRSLRKTDTAFQYADSLKYTYELIHQNLQDNYFRLLNHKFDKVDLLEKRAQLFYLFVRGEEFQKQMSDFLIKAEVEKNKATQQLLNANDTLMNFQQFTDIKNRVNQCQEMYEFSLVYYIEDYGGSVSLVPDSLLNDSAYIQTLIQRHNDSTLIINQQKGTPEKLNTRLIYKVQLGVFSKPLSPELTKPFSNITLERLEDKNLLKYMAGPYSSANEAQKDIKTFENNGFKGAFVVPFIDGKQVTWDEEKAFKTTH